VTARRSRATASLRKAEKELANLSAAVASGEAPDTLLAAIRERERQVRDAQAELGALNAGPQLRKAKPRSAPPRSGSLRTGAACSASRWRRADSCCGNSSTESGSCSTRWPKERPAGMTWA
jgi:hypothetical protein